MTWLIDSKIYVRSITTKILKSTNNTAELSLVDNLDPMDKRVVKGLHGNILAQLKRLETYESEKGEDHHCYSKLQTLENDWQCLDFSRQTWITADELCCYWITCDKYIIHIDQ